MSWVRGWMLRGSLVVCLAGAWGCQRGGEPAEPAAVDAAEAVPPAAAEPAATEPATEAGVVEIRGGGGNVQLVGDGLEIEPLSRDEVEALGLEQPGRLQKVDGGE